MIVKGRYGGIVCPPGYVPVSYIYGRTAPTPSVAYARSSANAVAHASAESPTVVFKGPTGIISPAWPVGKYYVPYWQKW